MRISLEGYVTLWQPPGNIAINYFLDPKLTKHYQRLGNAAAVTYRTYNIIVNSIHITVCMKVIKFIFVFLKNRINWQHADAC